MLNEQSPPLEGSRNDSGIRERQGTRSSSRLGTLFNEIFCARATLAMAFITLIGSFAGKGIVTLPASARQPPSEEILNSANEEAEAEASEPTNLPEKEADDDADADADADSAITRLVLYEHNSTYLQDSDGRQVLLSFGGISSHSGGTIWKVSINGVAQSERTYFAGHQFAVESEDSATICYISILRVYSSAAAVGFHCE